MRPEVGHFTEYMKERFGEMEKRFDRMEDMFSELQGAVDAYATRADAYFQEMVVLTHRVQRHERWLQ
jgi:hypothetical protein